MESILVTKQLTKRYGQKTVLDNVSVDVKKGGIYGLVGRNGAGKTTLMKIVGGMTNATEGSFEIGESTECKNAVKKGILIENPGILSKMTAKDNLKIKCIAAGVRDKEEPARLLNLVDLKGVEKKQTRKFSFGMKQRLGIALALVGHPELVILDEPINGLDPQGIQMVRELIQKVNREEGTTFLISSHILDELSMVATRYGFLNNGKCLEEIDSEALRAKCTHRLELVTNRNAAAIPVLERLGFENFKVMNDGSIQIFEGIERSGEITGALAEEGIAVLEIVKRLESLEDYFIRMIGREEEQK